MPIFTGTMSNTGETQLKVPGFGLRKGEVIGLLLISIVLIYVVGHLRTLVGIVQLDPFRIGVVLAGAFWISGKLGARRALLLPSEPYRPFVVSFGLFLLVATVSMLWSQYPFVVVRQVVDIWFYFAFMLLAFSWFQQNIASFSFSNMQTLLIAFGVVFLFMHVGLWIYAGEFKTTYSFNNDNYVPQAGLLFLGHFFWRGRGWLARIFGWIGAAAILFTIVVSGSRGGLVAALLAVLVYALVVHGGEGKKRGTLISGGGIAILIGVALVFCVNSDLTKTNGPRELQRTINSFDSEKILQLREYEEYNRYFFSDARYSMYVGSLNALEKKPLTGVGYGAFRREGQEYGGIAMPLHGFWLKVLTGTGLLGLVPLLISLGCVVVSLWQSVRAARTVEERNFVAASASGLVGVLAIGVFNPIMTHPVFYAVIVLILLGRHKLSSSAPRVERICRVDSIRGI